MREAKWVERFWKNEKNHGNIERFCKERGIKKNVKVGSWNDGENVWDVAQLWRFEDGSSLIFYALMIREGTRGWFVKVLPNSEAEKWFTNSGKVYRPRSADNDWDFGCDCC